MYNENDNERIVHLLENIEEDVRALKQLLGISGVSSAPMFSHSEEDEGIEGIFDGERMIGSDGKTYQVSANYASKSKLIEGDPLKLYITPEGKFFFKQLGPVERETVPAILKSEGNHFIVETEDGGTYSVLTASVTYYMSLFNIRPGDRLMILLPTETQARWAVIDNIL